MYRATSFRACSRVGETVRLTRSTFTAALNDSACALSKHTPVRPTERRIPSSAVLLANACEVYWVPRSEWNIAPATRLLSATLGEDDRVVVRRHDEDGFLRSCAAPWWRGTRFGQVTGGATARV